MQLRFPLLVSSSPQVIAFAFKEGLSSPLIDGEKLLISSLDDPTFKNQALEIAQLLLPAASKKAFAAFALVAHLWLQADAQGVAFDSAVANFKKLVVSSTS